VEKDAALARRFQPILVEEPEESESVKILEGLRPAYEKHHKVQILDEAIDAAVSLSARYISDRFLPDKAIDLMDEACSRRQLGYYREDKKALKLSDEIREMTLSLEEALAEGRFEDAHRIHEEVSALSSRLERKKEKGRKKTKEDIAKVTAEDIARTVSDWTKIPVQKLTMDEGKKLIRLEKTLHERIIG